MKILLTGPSVRNNGGYVDAGEELEVGDAPEQISADRSQTMLQGFGRAEEAPLELTTLA